jgi:hypothetical protein
LGFGSAFVGSIRALEYILREKCEGAVSLDFIHGQYMNLSREIGLPSTVFNMLKGRHSYRNNADCLEDHRIRKSNCGNPRWAGHQRPIVYE